MNYLQLCQLARQEFGISGTGPASVTSQTGESKQVVDGIRQAWIEIQNSAQGWRFLRSEASLSATGRTVSLPADFALPIALILNDGIGMRELRYMSYESFKEMYRLTTFADGVPTAFTTFNGNIIFNATPLSDYPLTLEYYQSPQVLIENTDVPLLPERFHMLIVYKAMREYGFYENAQEVIARAETGYQSMINALYNDQLPEIQLAGPLA